MDASLDAARGKLPDPAPAPGQAEGPAPRRSPRPGSGQAPWLFLLVTWAVLVAGQALVGAGETALTDGRLPLGLRLVLAAQEIVAALLGILLLGVPLLLLARRPSRAAKGAALALAIVLWLTWWSSIALFHAAGQFLDLTSMAFWLRNIDLVTYKIGQINPFVVMLVPAGAIASALAHGIYLPRWLDRLPDLARVRATRVLLAFGAMSLVVALIGHLVVPAADRRHYELSRDDKTGPFAHAIAEVAKAVVVPGRRIPRDPAPPPSRAPLLPTERWLGSVDAAATKHWNVVVLVVDSLRPDELRSFGGALDVMPALDAIAAESRRYDAARTEAPQTNYAVPCLMSSHYPLRSEGMHFYPERPGYPRVLVYDLLRPLGWRTAHFSSNNDEWMGMDHYLDSGSLNVYLHAQNFTGPGYSAPEDSGFAKWQAGHPGRKGLIDDGDMMSAAIDWVREDPSKPFYFSLLFQNTHIPYVTPKDFPHRFGPGERDFAMSFARVPRDRMDDVRGLYRDSLAYVDAQIARLVAALKELGAWDRTVVVVTADHGEAFGEHGFTAHGNELYDELLRVPLVLRVPGEKGRADSRRSQLIDVPPTLLRLLGLPPHPGFQGRDLGADAPDPARPQFCVVHTPLAFEIAVVRSGLKLIYDLKHDRYSLFDLAADPGELEDLSLKRPADLDALAAVLHRWERAQLDYYGDPAAWATSYPPSVK